MNHYGVSQQMQTFPNYSYNNQTMTKTKFEKSNEEFKEYERIIMDKRIAEINNVITKV